MLGLTRWVSMWVADDDPYASPPLRTPLSGVTRWDAWRPVPFGRDARDRRIDLPLVWMSLLVGAIPRQGKTFSARLAASGLILDAWVRLRAATSGEDPRATLAELAAVAELAGASRSTEDAAPSEQDERASPRSDCDTPAARQTCFEQSTVPACVGVSPARLVRGALIPMDSIHTKNDQ
jgi:hypothetical protein